MKHFGDQWSGHAQLLWDGKIGDAFVTSFDVDQSGQYELAFQLTKAPDYGRFDVFLNGQRVGLIRQPLATGSDRFGTTASQEAGG